MEESRKIIAESSLVEVVKDLWKAMEPLAKDFKDASKDLLERLYADDDGTLYVSGIDEIAPRAYKSEEEFLEDLAQVFREDYGLDPSQEFLEESGKNLHYLLSHFL